MWHHVVFRRKRKAQQLRQVYAFAVVVTVVRSMQTEPVDALALNCREPSRPGTGRIPRPRCDECRRWRPLVVILGAQTDIVVIFLLVSPHTWDPDHGVDGSLIHQP